MKLYDELASWWPLMSPPEEYAEEAAIYTRLLTEAGQCRLETVLELGSGGGNNASHMKQQFQLTLVDCAPAMLALSRVLNPECEHIEGDMRTLRLGRDFDAVFVHDAICYMATEADLRQAMQTAFLHCRPGGVALFAPDYLRENFRETTDHGGSDGRGDDGRARGLRYLDWTHDPDPTDTTYTVDYAYLFRDERGTVRVEHERHIEGLFARDRWLQLLAQTGFEARAVPVEHSDVDYPLVAFVARRPETAAP